MTPEEYQSCLPPDYDEEQARQFSNELEAALKEVREVTIPAWDRAAKAIVDARMEARRLRKIAVRERAARIAKHNSCTSKLMRSLFAA